jgi:chromosome segregation protein
MARIRLRSLKLTGFKSFPDEVELAFPGKVSAIIGPNGCGKSNLVDAILWVLGEQRTSLMRLKQMGDVVFTGAASRQPAGAAEVTLILESDDGDWKETDGRLEVRRRVFRTGPSEYRLNGKSVRLKDIFDQLAEVGLGTRAYSIIEQGRVGQVLSARPIDRRVLLEEAAGITRYKARKHEAELKLEHTRQNLLRLEDVIGEVKRTLRQIKRQAKQAERHQKLENELKDHLRRLFTIDAHLLDAQRRDVQKRRAHAENDAAAAAAALAGSDADLGRARHFSNDRPTCSTISALPSTTRETSPRPCRRTEALWMTGSPTHACGQEHSRRSSTRSERELRRPTRRIRNPTLSESMPSRKPPCNDRICCAPFPHSQPAETAWGISNANATG